MVRKTTLATLTLLVITSSVVLGQPFEGIRPVTLAPSDNTPVAGEVVTYTVGLNGAATGSETYTVSVSGSTFSSIPTSVTPAAGNTTVTFTATVSSTPTTSSTVTVTGNGGLSSTTIYPSTN